jgi:hypothetical protein
MEGSSLLFRPIEIARDLPEYTLLSLGLKAGDRKKRLRAYPHR